ncbi:MAG: glycosyltransferase family 2 protein [Alistipes sp.]
MIIWTILFWTGLFLVFYTYIGYGILLRALVAMRETLRPRTWQPELDPLPEVTLLIAAYNEEEIVAEKMSNIRAQTYPAAKLHIVWITDGSTDRTGERLAHYADVQVLHQAARKGKTAALNRAMLSIQTPIVICTDANTMLNPQAVREIVHCFAYHDVGCVAGEKRVASDVGGAAATEGVYWRYESKLKEWDDRLYTTTGAAGELFSFRRALYEVQPEDTLLDDFMISMRIAAAGYRIAYCKTAYALETPSSDMREEGKRKVRIAAGGLQSVWRLLPLLNLFRYGVLSFQYISHRVLRWTLTPIMLVALVPLNVVLLWSESPILYAVLLAAQLLFYAAALAGWNIEQHGKKSRLLFIPYYFMFMNINVFRGARYLATHRGGAWEKAKRG